jgi:hypothetical protein
MTDHPEWCEKQDDPIAVALWTSKRPALLDVRCGTQIHRLAKVYAANGKRWLCMPAFSFVAQFFEQDGKHHGDAISHMHAVVEDLDALKDDQVQRCPHGTYLIRPQEFGTLWIAALKPWSQSGSSPPNRTQLRGGVR